MSSDELIFRNKDGFRYKFPQNSCKRCINYPCIPKMDILKSDFAKFGCSNWIDGNIFNISKKK